MLVLHFRIQTGITSLLCRAVFFLIFLWICSDWSSGVAGCPLSTYRWVWKWWSWQRGVTPEVENSLCGSSELWFQSEQLPSGATWQRCPWDLGVHCAWWKGWFWVQEWGPGVDLCSCLFCTSWKGIFLNKLWFFTVFAPLQGFFGDRSTHSVVLSCGCCGRKEFPHWWFNFPTVSWESYLHVIWKKGKRWSTNNFFGYETWNWIKFFQLPSSLKDSF